MGALADGNFQGKSLVILGCGYVGSAVAAEALRAGMRVRALTRNEAKAADLRAGGVEVTVADLAGMAWHGAIGGGADFVLNCVSSGGGGVEGYRESYVRGMESVVRWTREVGGVGSLVYTSSTSVYPQDGGVAVGEESAAGGGERPALLLEAENLVRHGGGSWRRAFVLRLAGIYGPGRHHVLNQVREGAVAGRADLRLNLAHRDDIVAAILACFAAPPAQDGGVFNVADDQPATKGEIAQWLARRLAVPLPVFTGEPVGGRRALTPDRVILNTKLRSVLGWRPRFPSYREGYENLLSR